MLVYVLEQCVLGYTHHDMVNMFQSISPGQAVALEVCRGYPLPFDPNDPNTEIVTTVAVESAGSGGGGGKSVSRPGSADLLSSHNMNSMNFQDGDGGVGVGGDDGYNDGGGVALMNGNPSMTSTNNASSNNVATLSSSSTKIEFLTVQITKGAMGFGFTIADSAYGQKVKTILDRPRCKNLQEGDVLVEINGINMRAMSHTEVVQVNRYICLYISLK